LGATYSPFGFTFIKYQIYSGTATDKEKGSRYKVQGSRIKAIILEP
jgi:hypothetical protein